MTGLDALRARAAADGFSGVVDVDDGETVFEQAWGWADRRHRIANTTETRFGIASGAKGFTALAVLSLVEDGTISLDTTARSVLGTDLPLIAGDVTIGHLLGHRSGIGDYLDEEAGHSISDYVMPVPVHRLAAPEDYLAVLDGFPTVFAAGERFAYNNGGFVVLALLAERASGVGYHQLVQERVCDPAGLVDTAFLRSDELPGEAALGYLEPDGLRTNVLHLPVRGVGDGGLYSTTADLRRFWAALFDGRILPSERVAHLVAGHSDAPEHGKRYGLGFWLHPTGSEVLLEGYDAGVSFRSTHDPATHATRSVISNTSEGAWGLVTMLDEMLATT